MTILTIDDTSVEVLTQGEGPHLVLLPTLLAELTVYNEVIDELAEEWTVHRINFPGFGGSTGPIGSAIEDYADLIAGVFRKLDLPADTILLGNGFGGFVAGTFAIRHGGLIDKLILVDTGPGFPEAAKGPLRILAEKATGEGMNSVLDAAVKRMFPEDFIAGNSEVIDRRKQHLSQADPKLFANAALALTKFDNTPRLGTITNPTLIVVGLEDQTTPPFLSHDLQAGIKGSELIELPGIGHCPQLQDPKGFLSAIGPFLRA